MESVKRTSPEWLDWNLYPFNSHFMNFEGQMMHFLDEKPPIPFVGEGGSGGSKTPVLFVHGTPSWSFEFRIPIQRLRESRRVIAPDLIGFGLSSKHPKWTYSFQSHTDSLAALVDSLELKELDLVAHDIGGPIALALSLRRPNLFRRVALLNTWLWPVESVAPEVAKQKKIARSAFMRFLYLHWNFSARVMVKMAWGKKKPLSKKLHRHYLAPFQKPSDRNSTWKVLETVTDSSHPYWGLHRDLAGLRSKKVLLAWGMQDRFIDKRHLEHWKSLLPEALVREFPDAGHFVADEAGEDLSLELEKFLDDGLR